MFKRKEKVSGRKIEESDDDEKVWFSFYGTSTILGYIMPNPFLYIKTVLFQTVQFSIST